MSAGLPLRGWWLARTRREQLLLLVAGSLAVLLLLLLVAASLRARVAGAERRYTAAAESLAQAQSTAALIQAARRTPEPRSAVDLLVRDTAAAQSIALTVGDSQGPELAVTVEAVRAPVLGGWLASLEGRGVRPVRLAIAKNADATVNAQLAFPR